MYPPLQMFDNKIISKKVLGLVTYTILQGLFRPLFGDEGMPTQILLTLGRVIHLHVKCADDYFTSVKLYR